MSLPSYYSIVRYVPDIIRDEGVNIGVILETGTNGDRQVIHSFTESFHRAAKIDPFLNAVVLERTIGHTINQLKETSETLSLDQLAERHSGGKVQLTQPRLTLIESLEEELRELYEQFVWEEREARRQGVTDVKLRQKVVRALFHVEGLTPEKIKVNNKSEPVRVEGSKFNHTFDMSVQLNGRPDFIRLLSFDVEHHQEKLESAKALVFDASDILETQRHIGVYSVIYPPKSRIAVRNESFLEAKAILNDRHIPTFDFDEERDVNRFLRTLTQ